MSSNRHRTAWIIIWASFFACLALTVAVPVGVATFRQRAVRQLTVVVTPNQGTLALVRPGEQELLSQGSESMTAPLTLLITNAVDTGLVELFEPEQARLVARLQIVGNSELAVRRAVTPRFRSSDADRRLLIEMESGRLRLFVPADSDRRLVATVETPNGNVFMLQAGQYLVEVMGDETHVSVTAGDAILQAAGESLGLAAGERGIMTVANVPTGPFSTDRNLVANGDFRNELTDWVALPWNQELADQPSGSTTIARVNDEPALRFQRQGTGHIDTSLRQIINQELVGFESLEMSLSMRFVEQSLPVCGSLGTECPLTVRLNYTNQNGQEEAWQQGFYAVGQPSADAPDFCTVCGPPLSLTQHQKVNFGQVVFYESGNLLERMAQEGIRPIRLNSISLIAAGHSFEFDILNIALVAEQTP